MNNQSDEVVLKFCFNDSVFEIENLNISITKKL